MSKKNKTVWSVDEMSNLILQQPNEKKYLVHFIFQHFLKKKHTNALASFITKDWSGTQFQHNLYLFYDHMDRPGLDVVLLDGAKGLLYAFILVVSRFPIELFFILFWKWVFGLIEYLPKPLPLRCFGHGMFIYI